MDISPIVSWERDKIEWSDDLLLGLEAEDDDHREMFGLMNRVLLASQPGGETVTQAVADLCLFTREHFSREEEEMARSGYPAADDHRYDHEYLVFELDVLIGRLIDHGPDGVAGDLVGLLRRWLCDHIMTFDAAFAAFRREMQAAE